MLIENIVCNSLNNIIKDSGRINYWRTLSKAEVDFVITMGKDIVPVEVKFTRIREPKISRSFRSFIEAYNPKRAITVTRDYWGERIINQTKIKFVPVCYL